MSVKLQSSPLRANFNVETKIVLSLSRKPQGLTAEDISSGLGVGKCEVRCALKKLTKKKLIFKSKEVRKTTYGYGHIYTRRKKPPAPPEKQRGFKWS